MVNKSPVQNCATPVQHWASPITTSYWPLHSIQRPRSGPQPRTPQLSGAEAWWNESKRGSYLKQRQYFMCFQQHIEAYWSRRVLIVRAAYKNTFSFSTQEHEGHVTDISRPCVQSLFRVFIQTEQTHAPLAEIFQFPYFWSQTTSNKNKMTNSKGD